MKKPLIDNTRSVIQHLLIKMPFFYPWSINCMCMTHHYTGILSLSFTLYTVNTSRNAQRLLFTTYSVKQEVNMILTC